MRHALSKAARWVRRWLIPARVLALPAPITTEERDPDMPTARVNKMIAAGKRHLQGHPTMTADDYSVKQIMKVAVSDYSEQEQMEAVGTLRVEFQKRSVPAKA
jgi:hypothetical protein